jgi:phage baseplate assembly protein W
MDLNHQTGAAIEGWPEVAQSLATILATRLGTRVFAREFGSDIPALVDAPMNDQNIAAVYVATAEAIEKWEPRFELESVNVEGSVDGVLTLVLTGSYRPKAHLGDLATVEGNTKAVRIFTDRADQWSVAA